MNTIVIQTALLLEQESVVKKLEDTKIYEHPFSKTQYKIGKYYTNGYTIKVIVGRTNQTNVNAGIETERIVNEFKPSIVFFTGIAGSLKDADIGDIVIGSDVYGYEKGKGKKEFQSRPKFAFSSYEMEMKAVDFSNSQVWLQKKSLLINEKFGKEINVYSGAIASGEKVIASLDSEIFKFLKEKFSHALAVDMESLGFLEALKPYPQIKSLIIRGISDKIDGKEESDAQGSQLYASKNASEFLFGFIDYLKLPGDITKVSLNDELFEILTKLYPEGLKDRSIWQRAGGDLSSVKLYTDGKSQWFDGLRLIQNGGGGNISLVQLVDVIKNDFPNNNYFINKKTK